MAKTNGFGAFVIITVSITSAIFYLAHFHQNALSLSARFNDKNDIFASDSQTKMNLSCVLTASDLTAKYSQFIPYFIDAWRIMFRDQVKPVVIVIADNINDLLIDKKYWQYIRIFAPITNISTKFTAQYIRILYPSLMENDCQGGILISDIDMIPLNTKYYINNINKHSINSFIYYRNNILIKYNQLAICYNIATSKTWQQINHIINMNDITQTIISVYNKTPYDNKHGGLGWSRDQTDLYKLVLQWNESKHTNQFIKSKDEYFHRLDKPYLQTQTKLSVQIIKDIKNNQFSDSHLSTNMKINNKIINIISNLVTSITDKFYFITYASNKYFKALKNFIGSVHFWMPNNKIIVYDLGLNRKQRQYLSTFCNTIYEKFPFEKYPNFIKQHLKYYAWQPLVLSLASYKYKNILMEDSGQEIRKNIMFLLYNIYKNGYFFTQTPSERNLIHNGTAKYLNITNDQHMKYMKIELQGGIVGISLNDNLRNETTQQIMTFLDEYTKCAVIEECIAPNGSSLNNHRYSQSVQTILIQHLFNWIETTNVKKNINFWEWRKEALTVNETETNDVLLMSRRCAVPKPYEKYLKIC